VFHFSLIFSFPNEFRIHVSVCARAKGYLRRKLEKKWVYPEAPFGDFYKTPEKKQLKP
jgi:hypothetical protein